MIKSRIFQGTESYDVQTRLDNFFTAYSNIKILNLEYRTTPISTLNGAYEKQHVHYSVLLIYDDMSVITKDEYE